MFDRKTFALALFMSATFATVAYRAGIALLTFITPGPNWLRDLLGWALS